jgi:hypothetical protein
MVVCKCQTKFHALEAREDFRGRIFFRGPDVSFWLDFRGFLEVCATVVSWHGMAWHATDSPPRPPWHGMAHAMICLSVCLSVCPCVDVQTVAVTNTARSEKFREKRAD